MRDAHSDAVNRVSFDVSRGKLCTITQRAMREDRHVTQALTDFNVWELAATAGQRPIMPAQPLCLPGPARCVPAFHYYDDALLSLAPVAPAAESSPLDASSLQAAIATLIECGSSGKPVPFYGLGRMHIDTLTCLMDNDIATREDDEFGLHAYTVNPGSLRVEARSAFKLVQPVRKQRADIPKWTSATKLDLTMTLHSPGWAITAGPTTSRMVDSPHTFSTAWASGPQARLAALALQDSIFANNGLFTMYTRPPNHYVLALLSLADLTPIEALGAAVVDMPDQDFSAVRGQPPRMMRALADDATRGAREADADPADAVLALPAVPVGDAPPLTDADRPPADALAVAARAVVAPPLVRPLNAHHPARLF